MQAEAANATLTDACNSERVAQAISPAAGQAAAAAVYSAYGFSINCSQAN